MAVHWQVFRGHTALLDGVIGLRTRRLHCCLIFAWGNFACFPWTGQKGGFLVVAGKRDLERLPIGPATIALGAQLAEGAPDGSAWRRGGPGVAQQQPGMRQVPQAQ
jgi:hypothetical protein